MVYPFQLRNIGVSSRSYGSTGKFFVSASAVLDLVLMYSSWIHTPYNLWKNEKDCKFVLHLDPFNCSASVWPES